MPMIRRVVLCMAAMTAALFSQGTPNVQLLAHLNQHAAAGYNDCWGYTAPDGREYALLGVQNGTSIVDITDAAQAVEVAFIPSATSLWKDIKTYRHYAYTVTEAGGGLQIIDLSGLPNTATLVKNFTGFHTSHNIFIDEPNAILYVEGNGGQPVLVYSLADPLNPAELSSFGIECHDIYARDNIAYVSEGSSGSVGIYDLSNPAAPVLLHRLNIPFAGYVHNCWLSDDGNYLMTTEETTGKTIKMWDISDLNNITLLDEILAPGGLAHNAHIKGNFAYVSHYTDGLRIIDISDPANLVEVGFYDTSDAWGAFPFFKTGKVLISDINEGLYVVHFEGAVEADPLDPRAPLNLQAYSDYTTPNAIRLSWEDPEALVNGTALSPADFSIEIERDGTALATVAGGTGEFIDDGLIDGRAYTYRVYTRVLATDSTSLPVGTSWIAGGSPVPSPPQITTLRGNAQQVQIYWQNPRRNIDGTPMDDLAAVRLFQDGVRVATFSRVPADSGRADSATFAPAVPGYYRWELASVDEEGGGNESQRTGAVFTPRHIPFADAFAAAGQPDPQFWLNDGTEVNNRAHNAPSPPLALNLNAHPDGEDVVDTWAFDLSGMAQSGIHFSFYYQPQGTGNAPENGDSLRVYFKNDRLQWVRVQAFPGSALQPFRFSDILIAGVPSGGGSFFHSQFQVRFRSTGSASDQSVFDDWFIDDVALSSPHPLIFANPTEVDFDTIGVNTSAVREVEVFNLGNGVLTVSGVVSTNGAFSTDAASFVVEPGGTQALQIQFHPAAAGSHEGRIRLASNDPLHDTLDVTVRGFAGTAVGIADKKALPETFALHQNYPNPFNPATAIEFALPEMRFTRLEIYNTLGQKVRTLVNENLPPGQHRRTWNGRDDSGNPVGSGVYIYRLSAGDFRSGHKMILLR